MSRKVEQLFDTTDFGIAVVGTYHNRVVYFMSHRQSSALMVGMSESNIEEWYLRVDVKQFKEVIGRIGFMAELGWGPTTRRKIRKKMKKEQSKLLANMILEQ